MHKEMLAILVIWLTVLPSDATSLFAPAFFEAPPSSVVARGQGMHTELEESSKTEGFLHYVFGTDCYSQALRALNRNCQSLGEEERSRLALAMTRCFLIRATDMPPPPRCPPSQPVSSCTRELDERGFSVFTQFYTNIHSICLFVQNQDFIRQAEAMTHSLSKAGTLALIALSDIGANLTAHGQALRDISSLVANVKEGQVALSDGVSASIEGVRDVATRARSLQNLMATSLEAQEQLGTAQRTLAEGLGSLAAQEEARALAALERWEQAEAVAQALSERALRYEQLQAQLVDAGAELVSRAGGLQSTLDLVLHYERRGNALLSYVMGSTYTWSDVTFYGGCGLAVMLLGWMVAPGGVLSRLVLMLGARATAALGSLVAVSHPHSGKEPHHVPGTTPAASLFLPAGCPVTEAPRALLLGLLALGLATERLILSSCASWLHVTPHGQVMLPLPPALAHTVSWVTGKEGGMHDLLDAPPLAVDVRWAIRLSVALVAAALLLRSWLAHAHQLAESSSLLVSLQATLEAMRTEHAALAAAYSSTTRGGMMLVPHSKAQPEVVMPHLGLENWQAGRNQGPRYHADKPAPGRGGQPRQQAQTHQHVTQHRPVIQQGTPPCRILHLAQAPPVPIPTSHHIPATPLHQPVAVARRHAHATSEAMTLEVAYQQQLPTTARKAAGPAAAAGVASRKRQRGSTAVAQPATPVEEPDEAAGKKPKVQGEGRRRG